MIQDGANNPSKSLAFGPRKKHDVLLKLFSVTITHNYYTSNDALCPDFDIAPTPSSMTLMSKLGMAFRAERAGFSVFIQAGRRRDLLGYLLQNAGDGAAASGFWQCLSFSLRLNNPGFIGITALPIDIRTSAANLYGCNSQSHRQDAPVMLNAGQFMGAADLHPVVGNELTLTLPATVKRVVVTDISGAVVIPSPGNDDRAAPGQTGAPRCVNLDFSGLPYGLYTIALTDERGLAVDSKRHPPTVLYVAQQAGEMVLLDMLFTRPTPDSAGVYPILLDGDPDSAEFACPAYRLAFDARSTYWRYFVVPQDPAGQLHQLQIKGAGAQFRQESKPAPLPDGSSATVFRSDSALPLRQKSSAHFQLSGQRRAADGHENAIRISRLPVAAAAPVWPGPDQQPCSGMSEIFVYV